MLPVSKAIIVGFEDNPAVIVTVKYSDDVEVYATKTARAIKTCLEKMLVVDKTEAVLIANRRKKNTVKVEVDGHTVASKPEIDTKLSASRNLQKCCRMSTDRNTVKYCF